MATILSAAGATVDPRYPLDGEDLLSVCTGTKPEYDRMLFWRTQTRDAARIGRLKYLNDGTGERLFDLGTDPGEKVDLRQKNEGMFARIKAEHEAWDARMLPRSQPIATL